MTRGRYIARERAGRYLRSGAARRSGSTRARRPRSGQLAIAYAVILLGPAAYLALLAATGSGLSTGWLALALVGLALVRSPDSVLPTLVWLALGALWCMVADTHWLVLPAAAVALLSHLATAYVVGAPPDATVDRALAGLWAGRTVWWWCTTRPPVRSVSWTSEHWPTSADWWRGGRTRGSSSGQWAEQRDEARRPPLRIRALGREPTGPSRRCRRALRS